MSAPMTSEHPVSTLVGRWIGDLRGSAFGNLFAETFITNDQLKFRITANVQQVTTTFEGTLSTKNGQRIITLDAVNSVEAARFPKPHVTVELDTLNPNEISGKWSSTTGNIGVFWLKRVFTGQQSTDDSKPTRPAELHSTEVNLPKLTIYREELEAIVERLRKLIGTGADVVITARIDGGDVAQFAPDFFARRDLPRKLTHLRLNISDGRQPLQNSINIVLSDRIPSQFFVQSGESIWVNGVVADLTAIFSRYSNWASAVFQKYGLNLNGIFLLAVIANLPALTLINRYVFLGVALLLILAFWKVHAWISATRIYTSVRVTRDRFSNETPRMVAGVAAALLAAIAASVAKFVYDFLATGNIPDIFKWIGGLFSMS